MDLFEHRAKRDRVGQPLAERMRPNTLEEYVGQSHLVAPDRLLGRALAAGELPSLILWGPPGTGKTTLAGLLARKAGAKLVTLSAVNSGVKELREAVEEARRLLHERGERTLLFVDEIHRFNKAQQDALLPHVEAGTVVFVGATTENPSFQVVAPLLSRARVVRLESLTPAELRAVLERALADPDRGLGKVPIDAPGEVLGRIAALSDGDARRALATLEVAVTIARREAGRVVIDDAAVEEAAQKRTLMYDRAGDEHYGVVSALIKSLRGSDPDAAVYWMARMVEAGEDPLFVMRRLVIFAAEDVGLADPHALGVAMAALDAVRFVGLPEAVLPLTQAALYLALAPKSNTALVTYAAARKCIRERGAMPVPKKLRNAPTPLMKAEGHGEGYRYPHDFEGHYVPEDYLPDELEGVRFYEPSRSGVEPALFARLEAQRSVAKKV